MKNRRLVLSRRGAFVELRLVQVSHLCAEVPMFRIAASAISGAGGMGARPLGALFGPRGALLLPPRELARPGGV